MRLSEAIATGRVLLKPKSGYLRVNGNEGCALGMAALADGLELVNHTEEFSSAEYQANYYRIHAHWPWLIENAKDHCPACLINESTYSGTLIHIFDSHVIGYKNFTLDQLIDWVRSVEPAEPAPAAAEQQVAEAVAVRA